MRNSGLDWKECCARKPGKFEIMVAHTVFALPICIPTDFYPQLREVFNSSRTNCPEPLLPAAHMGGAAFVWPS